MFQLPLAVRVEDRLYDPGLRSLPPIMTTALFLWMIHTFRHRHRNFHAPSIHIYYDQDSCYLRPSSQRGIIERGDSIIGYGKRDSWDLKRRGTHLAALSLVALVGILTLPTAATRLLFQNETSLG